MEHYIIVKVRKASGAEFDRFRATMEQQEQQPITALVTGSTYVLDAVQRALRAACVPYSMQEGRPVKRRKKRCITATFSEHRAGNTILDLQTTYSDVTKNTVAESVSQPLEDPGS